MKCPACGSNLKQHTYRNLVVDICPKCVGIWFDPGEMKDYIECLLTDHDDIPSADIEFDRKIKIAGKEPERIRSCPRCFVPMVKLNFAYDSNVILDSCPSCNGVWTDGGEIQKLAIHTKGNPRLDAVADGIAELGEKREIMNELAEFGRSLTGYAAIAELLTPKVLIPLGDDVRRSIIPGVVHAIIAANVALFLYQVFYVEGSSPEFYEAYALVPMKVFSENRYFSFVSSLFLHAGWLHIVGNMLFLWIFGDNVEEALGHFRFVFYYLLFGLVAGVTHFLGHTHSDIPTLGASGAVSGVLGAYLVLYPRARIRMLSISGVMFSALRIPGVASVSAFMYLGAWIVTQEVIGITYKSTDALWGVGWLGHVGGFLAGMLLAWPYRKRTR